MIALSIPGHVLLWCSCLSLRILQFDVFITRKAAIVIKAETDFDSRTVLVFHNLEPSAIDFSTHRVTSLHAPAVFDVINLIHEDVFEC